MIDWLRRLYDDKYNGSISAVMWEVGFYAFAAVAVGLVVHMFVSAM